MPKLVVHGALLRCSQGASTATLSIDSARASHDGHLAATILDHVPLRNVPAFGMCRAPTNPQVAAATAAALGVLTPQPCTPVLPAPWSPGGAILVLDEVKALSSHSTCSCAWAGIVEIADPGSDVDID